MENIDEQKIDWLKNISYFYIMSIRITLIFVFTVFIYITFQPFQMIFLLFIIPLYIYLIYSLFKDYFNEINIIGISNNKLIFKSRKKTEFIFWDDIKDIKKINRQWIIFLNKGVKYYGLNYISNNTRNEIIKKYCKLKNIDLNSKLIRYKEGYKIFHAKLHGFISLLLALSIISTIYFYFNGSNLIFTLTIINAALLFIWFIHYILYKEKIKQDYKEIAKKVNY